MLILWGEIRWATTCLSTDFGLRGKERVASKAVASWCGVNHAPRGAPKFRDVPQPGSI